MTIGTPLLKTIEFRNFVGAAIAPLSKILVVNAFVVMYWPVSLESRLFKLVTLVGEFV